jgi:hypothetical protein
MAREDKMQALLNIALGESGRLASSAGHLNSQGNKPRKPVRGSILPRPGLNVVTKRKIKSPTFNRNSASIIRNRLSKMFLLNLSYN